MRKMNLAYLHLTATDLDAWRKLAVEGLDFEEVSGPDADSLYLRIDDRPWRFVVSASDTPGLSCAAWELPSEQALDRLIADLGAAGVAVTDGTAAECEDRRFERMVSCTEPGGLRLEFVVGGKLDQRPLRNIDGTRFVTGEMGAGHVVIGTTDMAASTNFYENVLGFHRRDSMGVHYSVVPGRTEADGPAWIRFYGANPRHHSLALFDAPLPHHIVHFMVEVETLDQVGIALDRVVGQGQKISASLGRHTNDHMVSFYVATPSNCDLEFGYGARQVLEPDNWTATEITAVSFWGHKFGNVYDH